MSKQRQWLSDIRTSLGFTHDEAAVLSGISRAYWTQIENGDRNPGVETAQKIGRALNFDWTFFYDKRHAQNAYG